MSSKLKLIVDKDLGHVLALISADDIQRVTEISLAEVLGPLGLLIRGRADGELHVPAEQLLSVDMPSLGNAPLGAVKAEPRLHIYEKEQQTPPAPASLFTPDRKLTYDEKLTNTEDTVVHLHTPESLSTTIRAKAYAQARGETPSPQILPPHDVTVAPATSSAYIPISLQSTKHYDVLVLIEGFSALLIENLQPALKRLQVSQASAK